MKEGCVAAGPCRVEDDCEPESRYVFIVSCQRQSWVMAFDLGRDSVSNADFI